MADQLIDAPGATLDAIARHIYDSELHRTLKGLSTNGGKNYATLDVPAPTPETGIVILPAPAVGPPGSTKICDGTLTVGGVAIKVTAFRLK
jgi:hypothetical protein